MIKTSRKKQIIKTSKRDKTDGDNLTKAISEIAVHDHLCLIYKTKKEQFAAVIPYMCMGLERGEKCIYIVDDNTAKDVLQAMRAQKIKIDSYIKKGAFSIITKKEAYLRNGYFDPDEMIEFLKKSTAVAKKEGYSALRVTGEMTWMLGGEKGTERLIEYEAKLNLILPSLDCLAICQYNEAKFSTDILMDVIHTHPLVISGDTVCKNFYYIPVEEFLKKSRNPKMKIEHQMKNLLDRERLEKTLQKTARYTEGIINAANVMIVCLDTKGRVTLFNEVAEKITGYQKKEVMGRDWFKLIVPRTLYPKVWRLFSEFIKRGKSIDGEFQNPIRTKQGEERIIEWRNSDLHDNGTTLGTISYGIDITARTKFELEREQFFKFFNLSTDIMVIADPNGAFKRVNPSCESILGYTEKELLAKPFIDFVHPDDKQSTLKEMARQIKIGSSLNFENRYICKDKKVLWLSWRANYNKDEKITYATARDITERKQAEEELHRLNRVMHMLSQTNQALIHITEEKTLLETISKIIINLGAYHLMWIGFAEEDQGKKVRPIVQVGMGSNYIRSAKVTWDELNEHGRGPTGTAIRTGKIQITRDISAEERMKPWKKMLAKIKCKSSVALPLISGGKTFGVLNLYSNEIDAFSDKEITILEELAGDLAFGIATLRLQKKIADRTKEVDELKNKFIQIVAHQLRTPLNVIRWDLETLLNRERGDLAPAQVETMRGAYAANLEIITRLDDLLTAIDIEEGRIRLEMETIDIMELFESVCDEKLQMRKLKKIKCMCAFNKLKIKMPLIQGDPVKMRDIIARLIDNAITYNKEGGKITVKFSTTADKIRFDITDTGIGIPTFEQAHVFERFYRGWNTTHINPNASGLSLYIAQHYIEAHQGTMGFTSKEKKGSTFWFELPIMAK